MECEAADPTLGTWASKHPSQTLPQLEPMHGNGWSRPPNPFPPGFLGPRSGSCDANAVPLNWQPSSWDFDPHAVQDEVQASHSRCLQSQKSGHYTMNTNNQFHNPSQAYIHSHPQGHSTSHDHVHNDFQPFYNNVTTQLQSVNLGSNFNNSITHQEDNTQASRNRTGDKIIQSGNKKKATDVVRDANAGGSDSVATMQFVFEDPAAGCPPETAAAGPGPGSSQQRSNLTCEDDVPQNSPGDPGDDADLANCGEGSNDPNPGQEVNYFHLAR